MPRANGRFPVVLCTRVLLSRIMINLGLVMEPFFKNTVLTVCVCF